jgi:methylmalonyl-CoA mutase N-terminal domain/subunit
MFIALGDKQRMDRTRYTVALQNDVLKEYVARGTQQIIAYEFGITSTVDPLGGAYYVESLCNHMEREIAAIVQRVDEMGGAVQAIEHRDIQKTITEDASRRQRAYERNERVSVGMNIFPARDEARRQTFRVDSDIECQQVERVRQAKHDRDAGCVREMLAAIRACAADGRNVMPALIDAVKAYAMIGEICAVLKEVYGEYEPDTSF